MHVLVHDVIDGIFVPVEFNSGQIKRSYVIYITIIQDENSVRRKKKAAVILKTGRIDNIDSAVFISSVESMLSKRPLLRITVAFFLQYLALSSWLELQKFR